MADEFDVLDLVTAAVESAGTGLAIYQGNSIDDENKEHITVNNLPFNELEQVGKVGINVNIFIKKHNDGLPDLERQKVVKRKVRQSLKNIVHPPNMYWQSEILWSEPIHGVKEHFDCVNIRLEIVTEKN